MAPRSPRVTQPNPCSKNRRLDSFLRLTAAMLTLGTLLAVPSLAAVGEAAVGEAAVEEAAVAEVGEKALAITNRLLLPYYRVDVGNINGDSTLFAVRNEGLSSITVKASYYELDSPQAPQREDNYLLGAKQIKTVQIRDVPNLEVDEDGFARGYVIFETEESTDLIHGDYFQITPGEAFATGSRLVDISPESSFYELCNNVSVRFIFGGGFTGGTQLIYWLNSTSLPLPANAITYSVYDEAGVAPIFTSNLPTARVGGEVDIEQLLGPFNVNFGALEIQFGGEIEGHVIALMSASGEFSVRTEATCRD